jgi:hypothetical protein
MKFMLFVCADRAHYEGEPRTPREPGEPMPWADELDAAGIRLDGDELSPFQQAKTVRVRGGEVVLADGPFAETKEVIAGYDILECEDLDEAVAIAARHPVSQFGAIEIRPYRE